MTQQEAIIEHLKMVQGIINRLAQTSFILKGWTITVVVALLGVSLKSSSPGLGFLALLPVLVFWGLDAYYLREERLFRALYELIREDTGHITVPAFSMKTDDRCRRAVPSWSATVLAHTEVGMYLSTTIVVIAVSLALLAA